MVEIARAATGDVERRDAGGRRRKRRFGCSHFLERRGFRFKLPRAVANDGDGRRRSRRRLDVVVDAVAIVGEMFDLLDGGR